MTRVIKDTEDSFKVTASSVGIKGGRYISSGPCGAARKAGRILMRKMNMHVVYIEMCRTSLYSDRQNFYYRVDRKQIPKKDQKQMIFKDKEPFVVTELYVTKRIDKKIFNKMMRRKEVTEPETDTGEEVTETGEEVMETDEEVTETDEEHEEIPEACSCPLTHDWFIDPVVTITGYSYSREAIMKHLDQFEFDPVSGENICLFGPPVLIPNIALQKIVQYVEQFHAPARAAPASASNRPPEASQVVPDAFQLAFSGGGPVTGNYKRQKKQSQSAEAQIMQVPSHLNYNGTPLRAPINSTCSINWPESFTDHSM